MSVLSQVGSLSGTDVNIIAGAIGTLIVSMVLTWKGGKKGMKKVEDGSTEMVSIAGASLTDNHSMLMLSESLKENTRAINSHSAALNRNTDVTIMISKN